LLDGCNLANKGERMETEFAGLIERGITGGIFIFLYWYERRKVSEVQNARIDDLHTWLKILARFQPSELMKQQAIAEASM
jgi:hypothetical protein